MDVKVEPGTYVLAVSGGVDSMVLLHVLAGRPELRLMVAHFEHGIRPDSDEDRQLVQAAAARYGLPFIFARGNLGAGASEDVARQARYAFLRRVQREQGARAIITAHHQDDALETALINMIRGTGPRGLHSLQSTQEIMRPLLHVPKQEITAYAVAHQVAWHEDSTNQDPQYLRNRVRQLLRQASPPQRQELQRHIARAQQLSAEITACLAPFITQNYLPRAWFIQLPHAVAKEAMAAWLRHHGAPFGRHTMQRLTVFAKTAAPGKRADIGRGHALQASPTQIHFIISPR